MSAVARALTLLRRMDDDGAWRLLRADNAPFALALLAGAFWGAYIIVAQHASGHFSGSDGLALAMPIAFLVPLVPGIAQGGSNLLDPRLLLLGALVGFFSSVVPYSLETEALRRMPTNVFSILLSLEPAFAALAGLVVLGQTFDVIQALGIAMVVTASIGVTRPPAAEA